MAKINIEQLPPAPMVYTAEYQAKIVRILQLALQRVNYTPESETLRVASQSWMGL